VGRNLHQISEAILTTSIARATNRSPELGQTHFVPVPAGWFMMGCEQGRDEEKPVHRVWVEALEMAVYQVRNSDWAEFVEAVGHPAPPNWTDTEFNHPDQPVVAVSWHESVKYCEWLSAATGRRYRLPTEAEWERAARGGRENELYSWGDTPPHEWPEYVSRWSGDVRGPLPVGQGTPNPYGLYDIGENVHEWCADWFDKVYYAASPKRNPRGPATGARRASRGGAWRHQIKASRCAARSSIPPEFQYADYGFRVVRNIL
jgi:formylglycine-generating enzyme required for sulfatase activity